MDRPVNRSEDSLPDHRACAPETVGLGNPPDQDIVKDRALRRDNQCRHLAHHRLVGRFVEQRPRGTDPRCPKIGHDVHRVDDRHRWIHQRRDHHRCVLRPHLLVSRLPIPLFGNGLGG